MISREEIIRQNKESPVQNVAMEGAEVLGIRRVGKEGLRMLRKINMRE